jgi:hypothetical protein
MHDDDEVLTTAPTPQDNHTLEIIQATVPYRIVQEQHDDDAAAVFDADDVAWRVAVAAFACLVLFVASLIVLLLVAYHRRRRLPPPAPPSHARAFHNPSDVLLDETFQVKQRLMD